MKPFVITHVLAATDLSDSSIPALRYARVYADRFNAKLTIVHVDPLIYPFDYMTPVEGFLLDVTAEHQEQLRGAVVNVASPVMEGKPYDIEVMLGQPIPGILAAAKECNADLIVVGTHLRRGWRRALLGSVSDGVLHGSECPVLTVGTHDDGARKPQEVSDILCPVNFTEVARESLHVAARLAQGFGARLTIVHVIEHDEPSNAEADEQRVRQWVAPELQDSCSYRELVLRGGPAERVLDCADDLNADLLVIGAQHELFRDATVIGTTSERLVRFASCPVLVVPRGTAGSNTNDARSELSVPAGR